MIWTTQTPGPVRTTTQVAMAEAVSRKFGATASWFRELAKLLRPLIEAIGEAAERIGRAFSALADALAPRPVVAFPGAITFERRGRGLPLSLPSGLSR